MLLPIVLHKTSSRKGCIEKAVCQVYRGEPWRDRLAVGIVTIVTIVTSDTSVTRITIVTIVTSVTSVTSVTIVTIVTLERIFTDCMWPSLLPEAHAWHA